MLYDTAAGFTMKTGEDYTCCPPSAKQNQLAPQAPPLSCKGAAYIGGHIAFTVAQRSGLDLLFFVEYLKSLHSFFRECITSVDTCSPL